MKTKPLKGILTTSLTLRYTNGSLPNRSLCPWAWRTFHHSITHAEPKNECFSFLTSGIYISVENHIGLIEPGSYSIVVPEHRYEACYCYGLLFDKSDVCSIHTRRMRVLVHYLSPICETRCWEGLESYYAKYTDNLGIVGQSDKIKAFNLKASLRWRQFEASLPLAD